VLTDPEASGCHRLHYTPPDGISLDDLDVGVRLVVVGDFSLLDHVERPVVLTLDGAAGDAVALEYPPGIPGHEWEYGCGSIEEAAPLPHPDSAVVWANAGRAVLTLSPEDEENPDLRWRGRLALEELVFVDAQGDPVWSVANHEVDALFLVAPPA